MDWLIRKIKWPLKAASRIISLVFVLLIFPVNAAAADSEIKYPPYPDVWDWQPRPSEFPSSVSIFQMNNGDVLIHNLFGSQTKPGETILSFFGHQTYNVDFMNSLTRIGSLISGKEIHLPSGDAINEHLFTPLLNGGDFCDYGLENYVWVSRATATTKKVIAVLYDKPYHLHKMSCDDIGTNNEGGFDVRFAISALAQVQPLADNTFLGLIQPGRAGIVLRLDNQLNSRSALIGKKIILVDKDKFDQFISDFNERWKASGHEATDGRSYHKELFKQMYRWLRDSNNLH